MVTAEMLEKRRELIATSPDLANLLETLVLRAQPLLVSMPPVPQVKALLSSDGGVCPRDNATLIFDPWSPDVHTCPSCHSTIQGERHHRNWARFQHLWLAERAAHLASVGVLRDNDKAADRAREILRAYQDLYFELPNQDNVLGPSHLFFSTYLESIWILNIIAAATILREGNRLAQEEIESIDRIADEAANVIGEFNEGFSNRQTWHAAALTAIAAWFGDEDLARTSIEERTGLLGHLADGFGEDGTWYEGENYHLFALRGLLTGLSWAGALGADLLDNPEIADHLRVALLAPGITALPDFTFPARKDSRFGVSLGQPMYLELWEVGRGLLHTGDDEIAAWLGALYKVPAQPAMTFESYLHEAGLPAPASRARSDLSWWSLLMMPPALTAGRPWTSESRYLRSQGLAILRRGERYLSLECGGTGGGHGHPDRLHLTLHADGIYWLPDYGTGSYVSRDLFWYRSTLAHNAPVVDGESQSGGDAVCLMFEVKADWAWVRGRYQDTERSVIAGPHYILDIVTFSEARTHRLDLPWHFAGTVEVETPGHWEPAPGMLENEFVSHAERFVAGSPGSIVLRAVSEGRQCRANLTFEGALLRARAPGAPGSGEATFYMVRGEANMVRVVTVLDLSPGGTVNEVSLEGDVVVVNCAHPDRHTPLLEGWQVETEDGVVRLAGAVRADAIPEPIITRERIERPEAHAVWIAAPPALDGTDTGFLDSEPLTMDTELQYRRSEEPFAGPEQFSAVAHLNWSEDELFLMVDVFKADTCFRPCDLPPLGLDNEADDIHSDGIQLYLARGSEVVGFLLVPESHGRGLRVSPAGGTLGESAMVRGAWTGTPEGYRITCAVRPGWTFHEHEPFDFDLLVNEMRPGRERRAGQMVWSGANGWVYLRGDRQDAKRFGALRLD
ncbi:MAG: heparinase II/III family protein [Gemmatimonadota bacterium]